MSHVSYERVMSHPFLRVCERACVREDMCERGHVGTQDMCERGHVDILSHTCHTLRVWVRTCVREDMWAHRTCVREDMWAHMPSLTPLSTCNVSLLYLPQVPPLSPLEHPCVCVRACAYVRVRVLQCVAVCCSVLSWKCVTVCCSVSQCVAVCCSVLQCVVVCCSVLQCGAVRCSVLQCVAV